MHDYDSCIGCEYYKQETGDVIEGCTKYGWEEKYCPLHHLALRMNRESCVCLDWHKRADMTLAVDTIDEMLAERRNDERKRSC